MRNFSREREFPLKRKTIHTFSCSVKRGKPYIHLVAVYDGAIVTEKKN
jgi:hypothetical protein